MEDSGVDLPETRYALSGDVSIACQVHGEGPIDLVVVPVWITNVEHMWEDRDVLMVPVHRSVATTARDHRPVDRHGDHEGDRQ